MEERIKQRLTGAAIVVALLVLLVPEMFRGRPQVPPASDGNAAAGPPVRSYTIDLKDGRAPPAGSPAGGTSGEAAPATLPAKPPPLAAPAAADAGSSPPAPAEAKSREGPPPAAATSTAAEPGPGAAERYQVQLGLFANRANADRLAARAARLGVRTLVGGPDARGLYRVHTATYASRADAEAVQQKLRALGLSAALTPER
jgi:DedD protein